MLKNLFKYGGFNKLLSLELFSENSELKVNSFKIENRNGEVSINDISKKENKHGNIPVLLTISIEEILSKKFVGENEANSFLSGLKTEDFYFQKLTTADGLIYNFIRKEKLDKILKETGIDRSKIIAINLLGSILIKYFSGMTIPEKGLKLGHHTYKGSDNQWQHCLDKNTYSEREILFFGDKLKHSQLIPFTTAIHLIQDFHSEDFLNIPWVLSNYQKSIYLFNTTRALKPMAIGFILLLLLHFIVFFSFARKQSALSESQQKLLKDKLLIEKLKEENSSLHELNIRNNRTNTIPLSYLLDRIASSKNKEIRFNRLIAFPQLQKKETQKPTTFDSASIIIEGSASKHLSINNWNKELNNYPFLNSVAFQNLSGNKDQSISFEIELKLNP